MGMGFRAEMVTPRTGSADARFLEAGLWLGDRDRALLAIASFIMRYPNEAAPLREKILADGRLCRYSESNPSGSEKRKPGARTHQDGHTEDIS
jgi:hypothetical protein